jgi:cell wall-associated NlpC family hydrolase
MRISFKIVKILLILSLKTYSQTDSTYQKYIFNQQYPYWLDTIPCYSYQIDSIIKEAKSHIGTPYLAEGKQPGGFDCSGFMFYLHKPYCIYLPYYSFQMHEVGKRIETKLAKKGDLILFKGFDLNTTTAGHVGLVISELNEPIVFIHSSTSKGIKIDKLKGNTYFEPRFLEIRRIVD